MKSDIIVWNCQGADNLNFQRLLKEYVRDFDPGVVFLVETRISGVKADKVIKNIDRGRKPSRPFQFLSGWLLYNGFRQFVNDNWRNYTMVEDSVKKCKEEAKKSNREVFGNILKRKRTILVWLSGIQRSMEKYRLRKLVDLEKELQIELESVLDNEKLLWKQKSRSNWLTLGNLNTKYFHSQANNRRLNYGWGILVSLTYKSLHCPV
ncbi:hypothetical protein V6Z12_A08G208600 [Gossypium hirsutum]